MSVVVREVVAGMVGFAIFVASSTLLFVLSGYDPHRAVSHTFQVVSVVCGILFALFSGYVTASISPASPLRPAFMVALLVAVGAILSMLASGSAEMWSQLASLFLMAPSVVIGARVRRERARVDVTPGKGPIR